LNPHKEFHKRAEATLKYTTRHEYSDRSIFLGLSLTLLDQSDNTLEDLKKLEDVEKVWPVRSIPRPLAHIPNNFGRPDGSISPKVMKSNLPLNSRASNVTLRHITGDLKLGSALQMSNVDKLHLEGIKGAGVKIAVIDTGVDYRHPSLGG
jgi:subtilisin family serine protease